MNQVAFVSLYTNQFVDSNFVVSFLFPISGQLLWRDFQNEKCATRIWWRSSWQEESYNFGSSWTHFYWKVWYSLYLWSFLMLMHVSTFLALLHCCFLIFFVWFPLLHSVSSLAWFMSNQETSFVTIGQRVLANPLRYSHIFWLREKSLLPVLLQPQIWLQK